METWLNRTTFSQGPLRRAGPAVQLLEQVAQTEPGNDRSAIRCCGRLIDIRKRCNCSRCDEKSEKRAAKRVRDAIGVG